MFSKLELNSIQKGIQLILKEFRVCVICISPTHRLVKEQKVVTEVDFNFSKGSANRLDAKIVGKKKKVKFLI